jgi:hypothetical protein
VAHGLPIHPRPVALLLAAAIVAAFSGVADGDFVPLDDSSHVYENAVVRAGLTLEGIRAAFTTPHASLWVPLTTCSFMADVSLFGLDPRWMHLENVAWHAGAAVLLFLALLRFTQRLWPSALVAALFGLHPINVESVAWIAERKNVLCAFFSMMALWSWAHHVARPRAIAWLGTFAALALALLAKPMAVTLPCVLLLLEAWPLRRWSVVPWWRLLAEKAPLFALTAGASWMATWATGARDSIVTLAELPLEVRFTNALTSYAAYLGQLLVPRDFAVLYPHPMLAQWSLALAALVLLLGVTFAAWRARQTQPWLLVGWLIFLGMLVPSIGLVQVGCQARADRFTYLAQIGIFIALVWSGDRCLRPRWRGPAAAAVLLLLAALTTRQVQVWRDGPTLFAHALEVTGPHPQMLDLAANAHAQRGETALAIRYWQASLALAPENPIARAALAQAAGE